LIQQQAAPQFSLCFRILKIHHGHILLD
jgi:hypothetical protein